MQLAGVGTITIETSVLIVCLLLIRKFFGKNIHPMVIKSLWGLVMLRILVPVQIPVDSVKLWDFGGKLLEDIIFSQRAIVGLWLFGICFVGGVFIIRNLLFSCILRKNSELYGKKDGILVYFVEHKIGSCLVGVLFPKIYISRLADGSIDWCNWIVKHELCHYRSRDNWCNFIRSLCLVVQWFNPLVWYGAKCSVEDFEMACDYQVIHTEDVEGQITYGKCLLAMSAQNSGRFFHKVTSGTSYSRGSLKRRLQAIGGENKYSVGWSVAGILVMLLATLFCFAGRLDGQQTMVYQLAKTPLLDGRVYCYEVEDPTAENLEQILYNMELRSGEIDEKIMLVSLDESMIGIIFPIFVESDCTYNRNVADYIANGDELKYVSGDVEVAIDNLEANLKVDYDEEAGYSIWIYVPEAGKVAYDYEIYQGKKCFYTGTIADKKDAYVCVARCKTFDELYDCKELLLAENPCELTWR